MPRHWDNEFTGIKGLDIALVQRTPIITRPFSGISRELTALQATFLWRIYGLSKPEMLIAVTALLGIVYKSINAEATCNQEGEAPCTRNLSLTGLLDQKLKRA